MKCQACKGDLGVPYTVLIIIHAVRMDGQPNVYKSQTVVDKLVCGYCYDVISRVLNNG